jgi:2-polyprenyl-3-methyl-5-hydroxy-6-metoxy-1,4-benzoquinol methylase
MKCPVCGSAVFHAEYRVHEMRSGLDQTFLYRACGVCHSLYLVEVPLDLGRYYPASYASLNWQPARNPVKRHVRRLRDHYAVFDRGIIGRWLYRRYPESAARSLARITLHSSFRVLDVGCGAGALVYRLRDLGFERVLGLDPYVERAVTYANGARIQRGDIQTVAGLWDVIMFHHSLEHINEPLAALRAAAERLAAGRVCLIRTPVVPCWAWESYGVDWVQLDAPRHLVIFSGEGLTRLAAQAGFVMTGVVYDSTAFQFWGSEQVQHGIPLESERSYLVNPARSMFRPADIRTFERQARVLNGAGRGDQAAFYLRKV